MKKIQYLLLCSLMLLLAACEKDTVATNFAPRVTTGDATDIYRKGAVLSGSIQNTGNAATKRYGILFSELESMAEYTEHPVTDGTTDFSISFSELNPGTTYYYSAYASSGITLEELVTDGFVGQEVGQIMMQTGMEAFSNAEVIDNSIRYLQKNKHFQKR